VLVAAALVSALAAVVAAQRPPSNRPQDEYLRALAASARGEHEEAVAIVVELEDGVGLSGAEWAELRRAQRRLARRLARRSPEALLPVALLHQRAYLAHARADDAALASAASQRAELLAQAYTRGGGDRRLAAALLTNLGGLWHARFQETAAEPLYRQALALDPEQGAAQLGLAVVYEKRGWLREAGTLLEAAASSVPDDRETTLRRALVHARSGRPDLSLGGLDELVREGGDDWIAALAYQESARLLAAQGRLADALERARDGEATLPCDPALPVLVAFYGEEADEHETSLGPTLAACAGDARLSPRRMYNQQPRRLLELLRSRLEEAERERLPALATALGGRAGR
jgi:tetratricopeptide (TPR) repeat protein